MALGVGLLGTEGRSKGIYLAKGHGHTFRFQLAGNSQAGGFSKEILGIIDGTVLVERRVYRVQGGYPEHFTGALTVAGSNQRGMAVDKAPLVEEFMDGIRRHRPHPKHRVKGVGSGAKMGNGAQIFQGVAFFLKRVFRGRFPFNLDGVGMHLKGLLGVGGQHQSPVNHQSGTHVEFGNLFKIIDLSILENHLQILEGRAVVEFDKSQRFGGTDGANPSAYRQLSLTGVRGIQRLNLCSLHNILISISELDFRLPAPPFSHRGGCSVSKPFNPFTLL